MGSNARGAFSACLCSEKGQAVVEHSLIVGSVSASFAMVRDNPYLIIGIALLLLIILLFWRPKLLATIVFIAVIATVLYFVYRWVEFGHF